MPDEPRQRPSLADLAAGLFAYAFVLRAGRDPGNGEAVRLKFDSLFREFEQQAQQAGFRPEGVQNAKYAMTAFVDELVLSSNWGMKDDWAGNPLQLEYFNDFAAGEEFYKKLSNVRGTSDTDKADVLEVFFLCLAHGFKGMYIDLRGMEERRNLADQLGAEIAGARGAATPELSPRALPPDELPKLVRGTPAWLVPAACFLLAILVALGLAFTINMMGDEAVAAMTTEAR